MPESSMRDNVAIMVTGRNQMVYWKGCNVTVYENSSSGIERTIPLKDWPEGQGTVPPGTKLYITDGRLKED
jgi:hypothetical protein